MKTFKMLGACIVMLLVLQISLPSSISAKGETELPLIYTLPLNIDENSKLAVSPDGKILFSGGYDNNSYLWHLDSGRNKEIEELRKSDLVGVVLADAIFSPDGKQLAVALWGGGLETQVRLFDSQSGIMLDTIKLNSNLGLFVPIRFSYDGKFLIAGLSRNSVSVIDMASHEEVYSVPKKEDIRIIRSHPVRNEFAVTSSDRQDDKDLIELQIRNTSTGVIIKSLEDTLPPGNCGIFDMDYSSDGKYFIVSFDKECGTVVYDAEKNYDQVTALDFNGSISFTKDSALAVIGNHVYPIEDKFKTSYDLKVKNSDQQIDTKLAILTPDDKYFITRNSSFYNSKGLNILDASQLSVRLTGIQIEPESIALGINESQDLKVTGIYSDGTSKILDANTVKWNVKNFYMAEVKESILFGFTDGSTELTAEFGGYKKTVPVVVAEYPSKLITIATEGHVKLTWSGVSKTKELVGYNVYRRTADGSYDVFPLTDFPVKTNSYVDENMDNNNQYYYIVRAVYANNVESRSSNESSSKLGEKRIVFQVGNPNMKVNGESKEIDQGKGTTPVIYKGRTVLPVRTLIEELGGKLVFDSDDQKLTIDLNEKKIELWIGKKVAIVSGSEKTLDVAPVIINGRTMLPLRFISENLGLQLNWDGTKQTIELIV